MGAVGGPERRTEIVTLASGAEERNAPWAHSRRRYDAGLGMRSLDDLEAMVAFFEARGGQLHGFRWRDWADWRSCRPSASVTPFDQEIGRGDGEPRAPSRWPRPTPRAGAAYLRPIAKPVAGTVRVAVGRGGGRGLGGPCARGRGAGGRARRGCPWSRPGYEFDVPVRFDTDRIAGLGSRASRRARCPRCRWWRCGHEPLGASGGRRHDRVPLLGT